MKILHIAQMIKGGPASYLQEVVPYQISILGHENVLVLAPADERNLLDWLEPDSIRVLSVNSRSILGLIRFFIESRRLISRENPDVVHLHSSFAGALVRLGYLFGSRKKPKIVYCAHGWAFGMKVPAIQRWAYQCVEQVLARVSDAIICISHSDYNQAVTHNLPVKLLNLIPNGIANEPITNIRPAPIYDPGKLNLLYVGRQDRQKGFDILVEAMRSLQSKPIMLHVVGEAVVSASPDNPATDLPNIVWHGWKSRDEVRTFMAGADTLVMPSRWEGFGLAAIEAMRQELPVCASKVDALPELIREGVSGFLFPPNNIIALADLLASLERPTLQKLRTSSRKWFLQNFTADRMNSQIISLYKSLLSTEYSGADIAMVTGKGKTSPATETSTKPRQ